VQVAAYLVGIREELLNIDMLQQERIQLFNTALGLDKDKLIEMSNLLKDVQPSTNVVQTLKPGQYLTQRNKSWIDRMLYPGSATD
jgi:hypothetical protein